jgi:hypothetical protein
MSLSDYQQGYWQPPAAPPRKRHTGGIVSTVLILVLAATSVFYFFNRQWVSDQITVWQFTPTAVLESYMDRSTMTGHAEFLFEAGPSSPERTNSTRSAPTTKKAPEFLAAMPQATRASPCLT